MTREEEIRQVASAYAIDEVKDTCNPASKRGLLYAGFVSGAKWADEHPHWISVDDELPEEYIQVLCHGYNRRCKLDKGYIFTTCRVYKRDDYKRDSNGFEITDIPSAFSRVTHWMPLPKVPKEGGEE